MRFMYGHNPSLIRKLVRDRQLSRIPSNRYFWNLTSSGSRLWSMSAGSSEKHTLQTGTQCSSIGSNRQDGQSSFVKGMP